MSKQPHIAFVWPPVLFLDCGVYMNPYTYQTSYNYTPIKVHFTVCCFTGALCLLIIFFFFVEGNAICVYPVFISVYLPATYSKTVHMHQATD